METGLEAEMAHVYQRKAHLTVCRRTPRREALKSHFLREPFLLHIYPLRLFSRDSIKKLRAISAF